MLSQPLAGLVVAEIQQVAEEPIRMLVPQPGARRHAFGLKPDDDLLSAGMGVIANRPEPAWETVGVHLPSAGVRPAGLVPMPAGIHPPVIQDELLLAVTVNELNLVGGVGVDHLAELVGTACGQLLMDGLAIRPGQVVGEHPSPPDVLGPQPIPPIELRDNHWAALLLARVQPEMGQLLPAANSHSRAVITAEICRPLTGPAQHYDDPFAGPAEVVEGIGRLRGTPARVGKLLLTPGRQWIGIGLVTVRRAQVSLVMAQDAIALRTAAERGVDRLDILDDRRVGGASVLEIHRPLDRGIVMVLHADTAHGQAALGIFPTKRELFSLFIQLLRLARQPPLAQEFR